MRPPLDVPVLPDAAQGRAWAREELARPGYERPGLLRRALGWLVDRLESLPVPHGTGSALAVGAVLLVVAGLVAWALRRAGGPLARRRPADPDAVFGEGTRSAAQHRDAADRAAAAGDWRTAVLERFRAVARELEERAVVPEQPGRTAAETAAAGSARLPALAPALGAAARLFDDVRYGDRDGGPGADAVLRDLDEQVRAGRGAQAGAGAR